LDYFNVSAEIDIFCTVVALLRKADGAIYEFNVQRKYYASGIVRQIDVIELRAQLVAQSCIGYVLH